MPKFGGFNLGNIGGALVRNAVGTIANQIRPGLPFSEQDGYGFTNANVENRKVSLRAKRGAASRLYGSGICAPLSASDGLVWPYQPQISYNHQVNYSDLSIVHANQDFHVFNKVPAVRLNVSGSWSVQNQQEGQYAMAALHFLRTVTKMNFGDSDPNAGTPPPILVFNAYGPYVFNDLPVIVTGFSMDFPEDVDYVQVKITGVNSSNLPLSTRLSDNIQVEQLPPLPSELRPDSTGRLNAVGITDPSYFQTPNKSIIPGRSSAVPGNNNTAASLNYTVWLPSFFKLSCELTVQHTPKDLRSRFNLGRFRDGANDQKDFI
jgi:hypothetical protein